VRAKRVIPRSLAQRDVEEAIAHFLAKGARDAALGFVDALEAVCAQIGRYPGNGSSRYGRQLNLPELRCWPLGRYPFLVFYVERPGHIDVWRVLHGQRDIAAWMWEPPALE
jgi:toxin ParE1/3/4